MYLNIPVTNLVTRASTRPAVYLNLVFYSAFLKTDAQLARAYTVLILLGILERLLSFSSDLIPVRLGRPWVIAIKVPIYFAVTIIRYAVMIAIMGGYIPMFFVICGGLALGQLIVECSRYVIEARNAKKNKKLDEDAYNRKIVSHNPLVDESCC